LLRASVEAARDEKRAALLIEESGDAFIAAVDEAWGEKIHAAKVLLAEAERLLDLAETTHDEGERSRLLWLFELYMGAAEAQT
jgi:hypothetical protein